VKLAVFGSLLLSGCGLVAVAFHERTDLEDTVKRAKDLSALAASIDHQLTEIDQPDSGAGGPRAGGLLAQTAILSDAVAALPALRQSPAAQSAQLRLVDKRAAMLPRKDPKTGEVKPGSQPLDADTKQAAHDLSRSVAESLKGKDPLELRELLKTVPGG
jgi:hypothetical protein